MIDNNKKWFRDDHICRSCCGTIRKTIDVIKINTLNVKILKGEMVDELKRLHEN